MIGHKLRRICSSKYLNHFRAAQNLAKSEIEIEVLHKQDAQVTQSTAGITVASVENYSPVSNVSVVLKAGSRYEDHNNKGIVHLLRNCATLSTMNNTAFALTRNLEVLGAKLFVTSSRDHLIYTLQCARDNVDPALQLLADVVCNPAYKPWELTEVPPRLDVDLAMHNANPESVLLEALHKISFRGGLGNSLFSPSFMIGKHTTEMLEDFVRDHYTVPRTSVVGLGIPHDDLQESVNQLFNLKESQSGTEGTSKFAPGELRVEANIPNVHTAIVAEGAGLNNPKEALSLGVLESILGLGSHVGLGGCSFSKLGEAAAKSTINPFHVSGLNIKYSDTGLFGVYIAGQPEDMNQLVKSVVAQMKASAKSISASDVETAKHKLKAKILLERETNSDVLAAMCAEVAQYGKVSDVKEILKSVDEITAADVSNIAAKVVKAKPAMASVGKLHSTPHVDELL
ncbi:hypothetical protein JTE90_009845 [Oedothorax gibbosus]|uniref:Cytochrome b-c1 complex subunit 2, mitochondrial n=1 Tax=Oedothorax gibbosus TaxID=931172 RepID=A0AAV6TXB4_9ARAC|nr:hypothetical protein JTE90_009845 [Oedothorax gibbosus]